MATADKKSLFVNGGNGGPISPTGNPVTDLERAQDVARRYRCEFVDLSGFELHHELFKKIPVELMFRYNFVPLEETSEGFQIIREDENTGAEETLSIDKLTATGDTSPIIRLVDTTIFTALQRRASDIHIETRDDSVVIKFRIDGVLTQAMPPIGKEH